MGALVCAIYLGLVQTLLVGCLMYLAALAVVARGQRYRALAKHAGPSGSLALPEGIRR